MTIYTVKELYSRNDTLSELVDKISDAVYVGDTVTWGNEQVDMGMVVLEMFEQDSDAAVAILTSWNSGNDLTKKQQDFVNETINDLANFLANEFDNDLPVDSDSFDGWRKGE